MLIIIRMAGDTVGLQLAFKFVLNMTVGAGNTAVRAGQRKRRLDRVIEQRFSPGSADMTERAISSIQTLVRIVRSMTSVAFSRSV